LNRVIRSRNQWILVDMLAPDASEKRSVGNRSISSDVFPTGSSELCNLLQASGVLRRIPEQDSF
jgi:hypothetical protein